MGVTMDDDGLNMINVGDKVSESLGNNYYNFPRIKLKSVILTKLKKSVFHGIGTGGVGLSLYKWIDGRVETH